MEPLTYNNVPYGWAVCFQDACPLCHKCLRYAAAQLIPDSVMHHEVVLPNARKGDDCTFFAMKEPVCIARGMTQLLTGIEPWKALTMRQELFEIFGSRSHFYRYRNGDYIVTPEQQERVAKLFLKYGIKLPPHFDKTIESYYFPS